MATRNVHVVRIKDPNDKDTYVDVKVYDQIAYLGPNAQVMVIDTDAQKAQPNVDDNTGDGNGISNGNASRLSHFERFTNKDDTDQYLDLEILDTMAFESPMNKRGVLHMPSNRASWIVNDTAGIGFGGGSGGSRYAHTEKVVDKTSDVAKEDEQTNFTGIVVTDAVAWQHENGERTVLYLPNVEENDTTQYTADDNGDNTVPPDNNDPNPYVKFPQKDDGTTATSGPWLGATPTSAQTGQDAPPDQGMLWKIVNAAGKTGPWAYCDKRYQPYEWSSAHQNLCVGSPHWDVRCFPYCDAPCSCGCEPVWTDVYGSSSCGSTNMRWPCIGAFYWIPCGGGMPSQPGTLPKQGYSNLDNAAWGYMYGDTEAISPLLFKEAPTDRQFHVTLGGYDGWYPNVYQMVGEPWTSKQPYHLDPNTGDKVWDLPSGKDQKTIAKLMETQWNATSDAYNAGELAMVGCGDGACCQWRGGLQGPNSPYSVSIGPAYPSEVDDWHFGCAIVDGATSDLHTIGRPDLPTNMLDFCGGLPPAGWWGGRTNLPCAQSGQYNLWAFHPATATNIIMDQLDRKRWTWVYKDGEPDHPTPTAANTGPIGEYP
jgi:hypothetical protein